MQLSVHLFQFRQDDINWLAQGQEVSHLHLTPWLAIGMQLTEDSLAWCVGVISFITSQLKKPQKKTKNNEKCCVSLFLWFLSWWQNRHAYNP